MGGGGAWEGGWIDGEMDGKMAGWMDVDGWRVDG